VAIFLGNIWSELVTRRGLVALAHEFGEVTGNWLDGRHRREVPRRGDGVLLAPSSMASAVTPKQMDVAASVVTWILFPDQMLGWDFAAQRYRLSAHPVLLEATESSRCVVANSGYTQANVLRAGLNRLTGVLYPRVDATGVFAEARRSRREVESEPVHVLWSHMWRTQKDPLAALTIACIVLEEAPCRLTIGRAESWTDEEHNPEEFKVLVREKLRLLRARFGSRLVVLPAWPRQEDYWNFLGTVDVSYSCSREESFGLALAEHASAGAACVAPRNLSYPEVHSYADLAEPTESGIATAILSLVRDRARRREVAASCASGARRHDVGTWPQEVRRLTLL